MGEKHIVVMVLALAVFPLFFCSCSRDEKEEELTPLTAPGKYGEVMGRALKTSRALEDVLSLKHAINTFHSMQGRYPDSLGELVKAGYIVELPEAPEGMKFMYDPDTGNLELK